MQSNIQKQVTHANTVLRQSWELLKNSISALDDDEEDEEDELFIFPSLSLTCAFAVLESLLSFMRPKTTPSPYVQHHPWHNPLPLQPFFNNQIVPGRSIKNTRSQ